MALRFGLAGGPPPPAAAEGAILPMPAMLGATPSVAVVMETVARAALMTCGRG